ncbi:MAG: citrate synthase [Bdellovibrionales bacterium]|jgi:citrate synthase|nr:citrate synthase [Bdellovibrionales bacterium]MBT3525661.1 citrate synthase [Bdellovibrionales bacterium]MBT7668713.1 citrate synthase [Bdellovibrionales bacterium]MBT7768123.1 citrate synthase [Bdellovibrionales bacterium]
MDTAKLLVDGKEYELPIVTGTMNERAVDITKLRAQSGLITFDPGYANTGSCKSDITYIDGERGILKYRGIPIEALAEQSTFVETAYLLIYGKLPTRTELMNFQLGLKRHSLIHEGMKNFYRGFPDTAHPMAILSAMMGSMSAYAKECVDGVSDEQLMNENIMKILSSVRTCAAFSYKKSIGQPFIYPRHDLSYVSNFLNMMFDTPYERYETDPDVERALDLLFILHADHEQNCSTASVRLVGSSLSNMYSSISSGISALWGPLHGGANQKVLEMLEAIHRDGGDVSKYINKAKDKDDPFRLMGFGHRVYKNHDPRATVIKGACDKVLAKQGVNDPLLNIAKQLEEVALSDEYFIEKKLYPNIDFYSGIIYKAIGIPTEMFTAMFAIARVSGWMTQFIEMRRDPMHRIGRPRQIYIGQPEASYIPIADRK